MPKNILRNLLRHASLLLVLLLLLSTLPVVVYASNDFGRERYVLTGSFEGQFELSSKRSQLFHLEDIIPGDQWAGQIEIKNDAPGEMAICLRSITSDIEDTLLFDTLELEISNDGEPVYAGRYRTERIPITGYYEIESGDSLILDVTVSLPYSAGNEIQNREMDSTWTFEAYYVDITSKPQTGDNLVTENSADIWILFILIITLLAVAIVVLRIRALRKRTAK